MFISKVADEEKREVHDPVDDAHEYATASELFDIMTKNQNFNNDGTTLSQSDLVLLYKNIDLGTKLMTSTGLHTQPNQHFETIVCNDDVSDTDDSDTFSAEDIRNMYVANKERMDFFNSQTSLQNTLCHKLGDLELQASENDFNTHFLFKDPYIKEQLKNFNFPASNIDIEKQTQMLPASLLDYICCKRLEDNYNFYMDNIIIYVKSTIEQLKRISNGDYLTNRAKEKWREVENVSDASLNNAKVLATSTSIPLHVERKNGGSKSTWDDLVHSAVDVRSLSKILEKKIVIEIPKLISGSYVLLSKLCDENLIISCQDSKPVDEHRKESRVDVVLKLKRSKTGHVVSNISSIMILQTTPSGQDDAHKNTPLPIAYKQNKAITYKPNEDNTTTNDAKSHATSSIHDSEEIVTEIDNDSIESAAVNEIVEGNSLEANCEGSTYQDYGSPESSHYGPFETDPKRVHVTECGDTLNTTVDEVQPSQLSFKIHAHDLRVTMQRLNGQCPVPEETVEDGLTLAKKKSPLKVRIKSPYDNKSLAMEEKKRRRLIEIRQKRERKKMAMAEKCKVTKNKFAKAGVMPQASSSVTRLSITNKSFYNSIYGQAANVPKQIKIKIKAEKNEVPAVNLEDLKTDKEPKPKENKGFVDRSYYLDDAVTEMMYTQLTDRERSNSTSVTSNDFRRNLNLLSQLIPSDSECNFKSDDGNEKAASSTGLDEHLRPATDTPASSKPRSSLRERGDVKTHEKRVSICESSTEMVRNTSPKRNLNKKERENNIDAKKLASPVECRKSIDKLYQLVTRLGKQHTDNTNKPPNKNSHAVAGLKSPGTSGGKANSISTSRGSHGSGTSHHNLVSPGHSAYSFDNHTTADTPVYTKPPSPPSIPPKVIINARTLTEPKIEINVTRKDRKKIANTPLNITIPDQNPLKAISQLLHNIETVQKNRVKSGTEKGLKKPDAAHGDGKNTGRIGISPRKRSRIEQHEENRARANSQKEFKPRPGATMDLIKIPYQQIPTDRYFDKNLKKKVNDACDEVKGARGEAVKGPPKISRLNSLAQPKKSYVQAHSEEYMTKYGRNLITDRLQRLATAPALAERTVVNRVVKTTPRRSSSPEPKLLHQPGHPLDRIFKPRFTRPTSPERKHMSRPTFKPHALGKPELLQNKMMEVEQYVNCHYVQTSTSSTATNEYPSLKSRTSAEDKPTELLETSSLPEELVSSLTKHQPNRVLIESKTASPLEVVTECQEVSSHENSEYLGLVENLLSYGARTNTSCSDEVPSLAQTSLNERAGVVPTVRINREQKRTYDIQALDSTTVLEKCCGSVCHALPLGTFCKHAMQKGLKLSPSPPTPSMASLFLLQSGDSGSFILKAKISQNLQTDKMLDLNTLPVLSRAHDWGFSSIPMQITTVGYAFPEHNVQLAAPSLSQLLREVSRNSLDKSILQSSISKSSAKCDFTRPTPPLGYRDVNVQQTPNYEQGIQVDAKNIPSPVRSKILEGKKIKMQSDALFLPIEESLQPPKNYKRQSEPIEDFKQINKQEKKSVNNREKPKDNEVDRLQESFFSLLKEKNGSDTKSMNSEKVDYTKSLDILVGILNEIKKITTCQTRIAKSENQDNFELEMLLNNTELLDLSNASSTACDTVSITSLDKHRRLDSNQSLYSFYLSDNDSSVRYGKMSKKADIYSWYETSKRRKTNPVFVDKEINVAITEKEYVHTVTDAPSIYFPLTINHGTTMSTCEVRCCTSKSVISFPDLSVLSKASSLETQYTTLCHKKVTELPEVAKQEDTNKSIVCYQKPKHEMLQNENTRYVTVTDAIVKKKLSKLEGSYCLKNLDDPVMKMKRDILVTIYSMLVLTVFAALSFPEVMYYV